MKKYMTIYHQYDFRGGAGIGIDRLDKWKKEAIQFLLENPDSGYYFIGSGRAFVLATMDEDGEITIKEVTDGYTEYIYREPVPFEIPDKE